MLVTGSNGQLGYDILRSLENRDISCIATTRKEFDICNFEESKNYIIKYRPDLIIHCAAYNYVDEAEKEILLCNNVNVTGTKNMAIICKSINATIVYFSTDYVFSGYKNVPYEIDDSTGALSVYGKSKAKAEKIIKNLLDKYFIIRTSWLFGKNGKNFVDTMLRISSIKKFVNIVNDQVGSPTYTVDLANLVCDIIQTSKYGVYHITNEGFCSWAEFSNKIFSTIGSNTKINLISSKQYPSKALRPKNSRLSKICLDKNDFYRLPSWENALDRYLEEINVIKKV